MDLQITGKALFLYLCEQLTQIKLAVKEEERKESVAFLLPEEWQKETGVTNQLAAVQYKGGPNQIMQNKVTGITLRLYIKPWKALGLSYALTALAATLDFPEKGGSVPYYDFMFGEGIESMTTKVIICDLFKLLEHHLVNRLGTSYATLPVGKMPKELALLPR
jgi:hypothetical protein